MKVDIGKIEVNYELTEDEKCERHSLCNELYDNALAENRSK